MIFSGERQVITKEREMQNVNGGKQIGKEMRAAGGGDGDGLQNDMWASLMVVLRCSAKALG